jgi:hypothetical protein
MEFVVINGRRSCIGDKVTYGNNIAIQPRNCVGKVANLRLNFRHCCLQGGCLEVMKGRQIAIHPCDRVGNVANLLLEVSHCGQV